MTACDDLDQATGSGPLAEPGDQQMTTAAANINIERARIECVFGLGGGELHEPHPDFRDSEGWDDVIAHWYEGVPEYATELGDLEDARTAILNCMFGVPDPPPGWQVVASFSSSGEAECWWCAGGADGGAAAGAGNGTGHQQKRAECPLCEGDGIIYIGDGWREVVLVPCRPTEP